MAEEEAENLEAGPEEEDLEDESMDEAEGSLPSLGKRRSTDTALSGQTSAKRSRPGSLAEVTLPSLKHLTIRASISVSVYPFFHLLMQYVSSPRLKYVAQDAAHQERCVLSSSLYEDRLWQSEVSVDMQFCQSRCLLPTLGVAEVIAVADLSCLFELQPVIHDHCCFSVSTTACHCYQHLINSSESI